MKHVDTRYDFHGYRRVLCSSNIATHTSHIEILCGFNKLKTGFLSVILRCIIYNFKVLYVFVVTVLKLIRHFARGGDNGGLQSTRGILIERCTRALIKFLHPLDNIDFLFVRRKFNSIPPPSYAPHHRIAPSANRESKISGRMIPGETRKTRKTRRNDGLCRLGKAFFSNRSRREFKKGETREYGSVSLSGKGSGLHREFSTALCLGHGGAVKRDVGREVERKRGRKEGRKETNQRRQIEGERKR